MCSLQPSNRKHVIGYIVLGRFTNSVALDSHSLFPQHGAFLRNPGTQVTIQPHSIVAKAFFSHWIIWYPEPNYHPVPTGLSIKLGLSACLKPANLPGPTRMKHSTQCELCRGGSNWGLRTSCMIISSWSSLKMKPHPAWPGVACMSFEAQDSNARTDWLI